MLCKVRGSLPGFGTVVADVSFPTVRVVLECIKVKYLGTYECFLKDMVISSTHRQIRFYIKQTDVNTNQIGNAIKKYSMKLNYLE